LIGDVPPHLVLALINDLEAEFDRMTAAKAPMSGARARPVSSPSNPVPVSGARARRVTPPPSLGSPRGDQPFETRYRASPKTFEFTAPPTPFPKLKRSVEKLDRTMGTKPRAPAPAPEIPSKPTVVARTEQRPVIVLVESDRMLRASIARALIIARFDVSVFDSARELRPSLQERQDSVVLILTLGRGIEPGLGALLRSSPLLRVLARTDLEPDAARNVLAAAGVRRFGLVSTTAMPAEFVKSVQRLLDSTSTAGT
jgi:hypothetical protein